ncbi:MAG: LysR family transcriptional regulator, regulator for s of the gallate degradation pathway [Alphaproteobacteria bacterium]|nr:LysR family transcriptional regulator, regulator for s of the gallate degradation pathway [Alphaproteobacteria bacterium]
MVDHVPTMKVLTSSRVEDIEVKSSAPRTPVPDIQPNPRRLRVYLAVYDCGGVHPAARKLHLSESSLTRAVQKLEAQVGRPLFERTPRGMAGNAFGAILAERTRRALNHLDLAETEIANTWRKGHGRGRSRGFSAKVTYRQLCALIAIADYQTQTVAARELALTQPALTLSLRSLERLIGEALFFRTSRGMVATPVGGILSGRAKLAFSEIGAAGSDISARAGALSGSIVVGMLPLSGTLLAPRAVNRLLREHPSIQMKVVDGTYQSQIQGLLCGNIDLIVGGLDYRSPAEIVQEHLFDDWLSIVARTGHPLFAKKLLALADLAGAQWVVPPAGTPARISFDRVMSSAGLSVGSSPIIANASPVRALLMESDRLAVMSRHQIHFEEFSGLLGVLPIQLGGTDLAIGIRTRAHTPPSAAVIALIRQLRELSVDMRKARH